MKIVFEKKKYIVKWKHLILSKNTFELHGATDVQETYYFMQDLGCIGALCDSNAFLNITRCFHRIV